MRQGVFLFLKMAYFENFHATYMGRCLCLLGQTSHLHRPLITRADLRAAPRRSGLDRADYDRSQVELEFVHPFRK